MSNFFFVKKNPNIYKKSKLLFTEMLLNKIININGIGSNIYGLTGAAWYQSDQVVQSYINSNKINYIHVSNESSGIYQSSYEAYSYNLNHNAKHVGIMFVTAGPGTTMALTGLASSLNESIPVVCFFGVPDINFQYIDDIVAKAACKQVFFINQNTVNPQKIIDQAFQIAIKGTYKNGGPGPVGVFVIDTLWNSTYTYTDNLYSPYNIYIPKYEIQQMINKIFITLKPYSKIIIRVGERVNKQQLLSLIELSNKYSNIYIHLNVQTSTVVNSFQYNNVGIEGPTQNTYMNNHYNNASHVLDIGQGIEYSAITYSDVKPLMKPNSHLFYVYDIPLQYKPSSMNKLNTLYVNPNHFIDFFIRRFNQLPLFKSKWWNNNSKLTFYNDILNEYSIQTTNNYYTLIGLYANILKVIYSFPNNQYNSIPLIDDTLVYGLDIGMASFMSETFINTKRPNSKILLSEFSPIGSSIPSCAGYLRTGDYTGCISIIGDGGFLNTIGYITELKNVFIDNVLSGLIILANDNHYSYVEYAEQEMFNTSTSITETYYLQNGMNIGMIMKTICGDTLNDYVEYSNIQPSSNEFNDLMNYVNQWYTNRPTGITIIHYIGPQSISISI